VIDPVTIARTTRSSAAGSARPCSAPTPTRRRTRHEQPSATSPGPAARANEARSAHLSMPGRHLGCELVQHGGNVWTLDIHHDDGCPCCLARCPGASTALAALNDAEINGAVLSVQVNRS
jgi:hypothetical protein